MGGGGTLGKKSGGALRPASEAEWIRTWGWEEHVVEGGGCQERLLGFCCKKLRWRVVPLPGAGSKRLSSGDPMMLRCFYLGTGQGRVSRADDTPCVEHRASNCLAHMD